MTNFAQPTGLGLKFAATDPDAATSSLQAGEVAGVVPQANWNNLTGATGTGVGNLVYDTAGSSSPSAATVTWSAPNTWRSGANNGFPDSPDRKLLSGYLDTGNTATTGANITVNNLDAAFTSGGYDVYVYFLSDSSANRGGGYTINDGTKTVLKYGSTLGTPSTFVEDPGTDQNLSLDGNYLKFTQLTGSSFTLKSDTTLTTPNGTRAPINAIQIVPTAHFGPDVISNPRSVQLYAGGTARFSASIDAYPAVTSVRWQKDNVDLTDNTHVSGSTTTNLVINNVTAADAGNYTLIATSSRGSVTTDAANLAIVARENTPFVSALLNDNPLSHWRLNEPDTVVEAFDFVGGRTGIHRDVISWGDSIPGPRPPAFPGFSAGNDAVQLAGAGNPGTSTPPADRRVAPDAPERRPP